MAIQFSGLASGLDTSSIISQLMSLEQLPITRLQADKTWQSNRLAAFTELDTRLKSFATAITTLSTADTLQQRAVKQNTTDYLTASASSTALAGGRYQVEVVSLAQVQKSVTQTGTASKTSSTFGTGTLDLTVGSTSNSIAITASNNSLEGIAQAINDAGLGVSAAIINDGSANPYRLVLTGNDVGKTFTLDSSGLVGGADTLGGMDPPVQAASRAHVRIDTIDVYSDSNTLTEAIPGITLDLVQAKEGSTTTLNVSIDQSSIKSAIQAFAKGYNDVVSFITGQSVIDEQGGGVLGGDAGINAIKRRLQNMLTTPFANDGVFSTLSQLGFQTQKDGTIIVDDKMLGKALDNNLDSVVNLLAGKGGSKGIAAQFQDYLNSMTSSTTGMLQGRKTSINDNIKQIDTRIASLQARLDQRQKTLEAQFAAMETLVSSLNSQSSYLNQQMTALSNMMNSRSK